MSNLLDIETEFNRTFVYTNPDATKGPNVWRTVNMHPGKSTSSEVLKNIYTLLPINKREQNFNGETYVILFFDIASLPSVGKVSTRKSYFNNTLHTFTSLAGDLPKANNMGIKSISAVDPVKAEVVDWIGIFYFDMRGLPKWTPSNSGETEDSTADTINYNSKSVDRIPAIKPLYSVTANDAVNVSFDFRDLPAA